MDEYEIVGRWLGGKLVLTHEQEAKGRNLALRETAELRLDAVRVFYNLEPLATAAETPVERPKQQGTHSGY